MDEKKNVMQENQLQSVVETDEKVGPICSIVIPAHNEEQVIARCLRSLLDGCGKDEIDVIVVANNCDDKTVEIASSFGAPVRVIETPIGNKAHAMDLGDEAAMTFPRIYLDADIVIPIDSVRKVAKVLSERKALCASPRMRLNLDGRSWGVKAYYDIWSRLPYAKQQMIGSGVYALSEEGRSRFGKFPNLLAEDEFIRLTFSEDERQVINDCWFQVDVPKTLRDLTRLRMRWDRGVAQFSEKYPDLKKREKRNYRGALARLAGNPVRWPALATYVSTWMVTKVGGRLQRRFKKNEFEWTRDQSARMMVKPEEQSASAPGS